MKTIVLTPGTPLTGGWTDAKARNATRSRLTKAANLLAEIAVIWGDVDQSAVDMAENLIDDIRSMDRDLQSVWKGDAS